LLCWVKYKYFSKYFSCNKLVLIKVSALFLYYGNMMVQMLFTHQGMDHCNQTIIADLLLQTNAIKVRIKLLKTRSSATLYHNAKNRKVSSKTLCKIICMQ